MRSQIPELNMGNRTRASPSLPSNTAPHHMPKWAHESACGHDRVAQLSPASALGRELHFFLLRPLFIDAALTCDHGRKY